MKMTGRISAFEKRGRCKVTLMLLLNTAWTAVRAEPAALAFATARLSESAHVCRPASRPSVRLTPTAFSWFFNQDKDEEVEGNAAGKFAGGSAREAEAMHRTAKMMEDHRRSQEAAECTTAMMEELSSLSVVGRSRAGVGGGIIGMGGGDGRMGGVRVTYDGRQRPTGVEVDPNFLFSFPPASSEGSGGLISTEDLNEAILDAMRDGYEQSSRLIEERIKGLYGQLGLPRERPPLPSDEGDREK